MLYAKPQPGPKKPSDKVVLQMSNVSDIPGIDSGKKSRKPKRPKHDDSHSDSSDQLENQTLGQVRDLFLLIKSSLFEEDDSIYESYWQKVFQQYYSN